MSQIHGRVMLSRRPGGKIHATFFPTNLHQTKAHRVPAGGLEQMEHDLVRTYQLTPAQAKSLIIEVSTLGTAMVETDLDEELLKNRDTVH